MLINSIMHGKRPRNEEGMIKKEGLFFNEGMTKSDRSLHTPGNFAKQNLLYVQEVGRLQSLTPHRCIRENLDSFLFLIVLEGKGYLNIAGKHYEIQKGTGAFIDCMRHYEHVSDEADAWKLAWVHFNGYVARGYYELFLKYNGNENIFTANPVKQWDDIVGELLEKQNDKSLIAELSSGELLLRLTNLMIERVANDAVSENKTEKLTANEIREYLNEKYADAEVLSNMEKEFSESAEELDKSFIRYLGISMEEYISNRRLNAAKELLRFTIKPIAQVAMETGIGDIAAMQQMFRESEDMSVEEYRMKWAQWIR